MTDKGPRIKKTVPGDAHERLVCPECDYVVYDNPKIVNVVVATYKDEFLLCKRDIDPVGYWTLPGGYMENGETLKQGALREAFEEAAAKPKIGALLAIYQPPGMHEVIMIFRGELPARQAAPGHETQETEFFKWEDIPWNDLAFPFITEALKAYKKHEGKTDFQPEIIQDTKPYAPRPNKGSRQKPPTP